MLTACTFEIDDVEAAVSEILDQLDISKNLLKNSVGLVCAYNEFISSGVVAALAARLPFKIAGYTSISGATNGGFGTMALTLTVLTSDSLSFSAALSSPFTDAKADPSEIFKSTYKNAAQGFSGQTPALSLVFAPILEESSTDRMLEHLVKVLGSNVPVFGAIASDENGSNEKARIIYDGDARIDCFAMVLVYGDLKPKFITASIQTTKSAPAELS